MNGCEHLAEFLRTEQEIIRRHLDEHIFLRGIGDRNAAVTSFVNDYGWLMRELYCTAICSNRSACPIARRLHEEGDLLRHHSSQSA